MRDAVIVAEERGRTVQPGPFVSTNVVALALAEAGRRHQQAAWLPRLANGEVSAAWAVSDGSGVPDAGALRARTIDAGFALSGTAGLVSDAASAGLLLATAFGEAGEAVQCLVPADAVGVEITQLTGLDITREFARVTFADVRVQEEDVLTTSDPGSLLDRLVDVAATLCVAESVGAMSRLVELTVGYAKDRTAFGRPIGSFQALKHLLADTSFLVEVSAGGATAAASRGRRPFRGRLGDREHRQGVRRRRGSRGGAGLPADARRHRLHVGARFALLPSALSRRPRALRRPVLAP